MTDMNTKAVHLQMVQAAITRMAGNSFLIKGWSVTLIAALFALAAANTNELFIYLAYFPTFMFWALDAHFLRQERLFRKLYDHIRTSDAISVDFSMDTQPFTQHVDGPGVSPCRQHFAYFTAPSPARSSWSC